MLKTLVCTLVLLPSLAGAHGLYTEEAADVSPGWQVPSVAEVELAIDAAAAEFFVPASLLRAVAHIETRWQHMPYRIGNYGRRGLFHLTEVRLLDGEALLGSDHDHVVGDYVTHIRAFAALLDDARPASAPMPPVGEWGEALAWVMDLHPDAYDTYMNRVFNLVNDGLVDRLADTGEPITIAPVAIDGELLGAWQSSVERSPDYPGAVWDQASTCNFTNASRTSGDIDRVLIHTAQGSYGGTISWFNNCAASVSTHYVISSGGDITQMLYEEDIGWHVQCWNSRSIGIEHEGYVNQPSLYYTPAMYQASGDLVADMIADWNMTADRVTVVGHNEVDPACNTNAHSDPGSGWDWDEYMDIIGGTNVTPPDPTNLVGYVRHTDLYDSANGVSGATVDVSGMGTTTTSSSGYYAFNDINPGTYQVCADASGYTETCISKVVAPEITNWGSVLIVEDTGDDDDSTPDPVDDDDTTPDPVDDDDTTPEPDDDDATADDDDTTPGPDDDDVTADDDDTTPIEEDPDVVVGGTRNNLLGDDDDSTNSRGCRSGCSAGAPAPIGWGLLLLIGWRRRR